MLPVLLQIPSGRRMGRTSPGMHPLVLVNEERALSRAAEKEEVLRVHA